MHCGLHNEFTAGYQLVPSANIYKYESPAQCSAISRRQILCVWDDYCSREPEGAAERDCQHIKMIPQTFSEQHCANNSCHKSFPGGSEKRRKTKKQKKKTKNKHQMKSSPSLFKINWRLGIPRSVYCYAHWGIAMLYCSISPTGAALFKTTRKCECWCSCMGMIQLGRERIKQKEQILKIRWQTGALSAMIVPPQNRMKRIRISPNGEGKSYAERVTLLFISSRANLFYYFDVAEICSMNNYLLLCSRRLRPAHCQF